MAPPPVNYGPSMLDTIEIGDRFVRNFGDAGETAYIVEGKTYLDDMTIMYEMRSTRGTRWRKSLLHESTLKRSGMYHRTFVTPRTIIHDEKIFTGVHYGTA